MKLKKKYKIALAVSNDDTRFSLNHPILTKFKNKDVIVATNGRMLAIVPCTREKNDKPGYVPTQTIEDATKTSLKSNEEITIDLSNSEMVPALVKEVGVYTRDYGHFPNYEQIVNDSEQRTTKAKVTFDIVLLQNLAKALGAGTSVTLTIKDELNAIEVTSSNNPEVLGLLMPLKV